MLHKVDSFLDQKAKQNVAKIFPVALQFFGTKKGINLTFWAYVLLGLSKDLRWSGQVPFKSWLMDGQKDKNSDEKLSFVKKVYQPFQ